MYLVAVGLLDFLLVFLSKDTSQGFDRDFRKQVFEMIQARVEIPRLLINHRNYFVVDVSFHDERRIAANHWSVSDRPLEKNCL